MAVVLMLGGNLTNTNDAHAGIIRATASVDAAQEVPTNDSTASGAAFLTFDDQSGDYSFALTVAGISLTDISFPAGEGLAFGVNGPVHLHNAPAGVNGPIVLPFASEALYSETADGFELNAAGQLQDALVGISVDDFIDEVVSGRIYVNIHTFPDFPAGEIRGQFAVIVEPASLILFGLGLVVIVVAARLPASNHRRRPR